MHQVQPTRGNFFAVVKLFDANTAISTKFVLHGTVQNSNVGQERINSSPICVDILIRIDERFILAAQICQTREVRILLTNEPNDNQLKRV